MLNEKQIKNLKALSDKDKCQIFDIILQSSDFESKIHYFNELVENLGLCDIKTFSQIMQINLRNVYRKIDKLNTFKIDNITLIAINS